MFHLRALPRPLLRLTLQQLNPAHTRSFASTARRLSLPPTQLPAAPLVAPTSDIAPPPAWAVKIPLSARWIHPYMSLARMDKPIGTWLLYWPCAWSITMAAYSSAMPLGACAWNLALFGTGALVMRGAGCTINDMWDRDIDKKVERTKSRPLASGEISQFQALSFLGLQLSVGLGVLTQLNLYSIALGASSLSLVVLYPLMKRITYWPQFVLGMAFNWGALLGSSAVLGVCNWTVALPLYIGSIAWTIVYDTIYAHQDKVDDVSAGVKSTALLFGSATKPILTGFSASFISLLALAGHLNAQGVPFYLISVGGAVAHLMNQLRTVDLESRASCWKAFASNRDLGAIVWGGIAVDYAVAASGVMA